MHQIPGWVLEGLIHGIPRLVWRAEARGRFAAVWGTPVRVEETVERDDDHVHRF